MARILVLLALGLIIYYLLKRLYTSSAPPHAQTAQPEEKFVVCTVCGVHIPESQSQVSNGQVRCANPECSASQDQQHGD